MVGTKTPPRFIIRLDLEDTVYKQLESLGYKVKKSNGKGKKVWFDKKEYNLKNINTPKLVGLFDALTKKHNIKWDYNEHHYMPKYIAENRS
ncbi:hypothetical protein LCGC14_0175320 [marine sediment metagenome]|uniref:Uncharacterized protein n=1 Tax=marine sediment metagenome TaxID=412755 RepID=A0A0F9XTP3_9ZZZZ